MVKLYKWFMKDLYQPIEISAYSADEEQVPIQKAELVKIAQSLTTSHFRNLY